MEPIFLPFDEINYTLPMIYVQGTGDSHFRFGLENDQLRVSINDFYISKYPVTQALWAHVMGHNPAHFLGENKPVDSASYNEIVAEQGFLQRISGLCKEKIRTQLKQDREAPFRLPTETEWEYAARGGIYWGDYFIYSGSDNIDEVGWYKHNSNNETHPVGQKQPNQLGIHDMCGNVWEWCLDYFQRDTKKIPLDGSPSLDESPDRVLRGGCFHNSGIHCTVMKRYESRPEAKDPCFGFRLAMSC